MISRIKAQDYLLNIYYMIGRAKTVVVETVRSVFWYLKYSYAFRAHLLNDFDLVNVKEYSFLSWHLGSNYFVCSELSSGKQIFLKTYRWIELSFRESSALKIIHDHNIHDENLFPKVIACGTRRLFPFVAFEFIKGRSLKEFLIDKKRIPFHHKRRLLQQMVLILDILHKTRIIHRDVRPDNLFVIDSDNSTPLKLVLIDFAFSVGIQSQFSCLPELQQVFDDNKILRMLGDGLNPGQYIWDDAYSFCKIARIIDPQCEYTFPHEWHGLHSRVGKLVFRHK